MGTCPICGKIHREYPEECLRAAELACKKLCKGVTHHDDCMLEDMQEYVSCGRSVEEYLDPEDAFEETPDEVYARQYWEDMDREFYEELDNADEPLDWVDDFDRRSIEDLDGPIFDGQEY